MYYCFNPDCEMWGCAIPQEVIGVTLIYIWPPVSVIGHTDCPSCGCNSYWHDAWDENERTHDDGTPVTAENP